MSGKRRANVMVDYVCDSSSDEDRNDDPRDGDFEISSSGRSLTGHQGSVGSNGSSDTRRRGRGVSKRPCLNRNALMARENRQRKKEYLEKIESKLSFYRQENKNLTNVIQRQDIDLKRLKAEVLYLKNVLQNNSSITTLLKSMNDTLSVNNKNNECAAKKIQNTEMKNDKFDKKMENNWDSNYWRRGGKYIDNNSKTQESYEHNENKKNGYSLADSDHTYTTSRDGSLNEGKIQNYAESDDNSSYGKEDRTFLQINEKNTKNIQDRSTASLLGILDNELEDLPQFDANIFDSLTNSCNDVNGTMDYFHDTTDVFNDPGNLFESLQNSGICLHVNSGKISLEFCSICHLNSINSSE